MARIHICSIDSLRLSVKQINSRLICHAVLQSDGGLTPAE